MDYEPKELLALAALVAACGIALFGLAQCQRVSLEQDRLELMSEQVSKTQ